MARSKDERRSAHLCSNRNCKAKLTILLAAILSLRKIHHTCDAAASLPRERAASACPSIDATMPVAMPSACPVKRCRQGA